MKQKKILSLAILSFLIISTPKIMTAQTKKGNWLAEGNLGNINLSNNKNESISGPNTGKTESQDFYISLYPRIGYFINDNFVIGTTLNISYQTNRYKSYWSNGVKSYDGKYKGSSTGLSPFLRYYFTKNAKNRLYSQIGGGMNMDIFRNDELTTFYDTGDISGTYKNSLKGQVISGEALIGFNHFFTNKIAVNSSIGYNYSKRIQNTTFNSTYGGITSAPQETKSTNVTGNVVWNFGFTIIIAGKNEK
ncbi:MAG: hypothetical protein H0U95_09045 [Bacteroidetes bacterium]|nr:hypothetical protein [Bacteroidota bacterium]